MEKCAARVYELLSAPVSPTARLQGACALLQHMNFMDAVESGERLVKFAQTLAMQDDASPIYRASWQSQLGAGMCWVNRFPIQTIAWMFGWAPALAVDGTTSKP